MADDGSKQSGTEWPLPKFYFLVKCESLEMRFQEVSGLDAASQPIDYRAGNSKPFSTVKVPGLKKFGKVTMKKGVFMGDNKLWNRFNEIEFNTIKRKVVTVSLLDETGQPTMVWTLTSAWPTKITGSDLKASGNEVTVETMVFAHEGLTLSDG